MLLVLELDVADLAATRFAISPLCETLRAVALLGGVARVWDDLEAPEPGSSGRTGDLAAVEALLGAPRARLLSALRSPATTSVLADRFGVTPGAVSQHLAVLYRGGLVDRQRSGRTVLYQASELGLALLGASS